jgi:TonB family protein
LPFAELDRQVKSEPGGWSGNKERLSSFFNEERKRLGNRFEEELLKYITGDVEKHYWISFFLESPSYLHGNKPLPHLSLLIKQQGLALLDGRKDEESRGRTVSMSVTAAVLAEQLGLHALAISYKDRTQRLLLEDETLSAYFPGMSEGERDIYKRIRSSVRGSIKSDPVGERDESEPKARVMGGILNGKAVVRPLPSYPAEARAAGASGEVRVKIYVDESGKVIWARAVEGHQLLHAAAEDAARRTSFQPMTVSGKPEKVMGFLLYRFMP